jgi:hypothetical protein
MQAKLLDVPPDVTDLEWAEEVGDQLELLLLEVGGCFPRADLRRRAAACVRGLLAPLSRKNGWVRHEAPCDRVEVRDLHRLAVAAAG